MREFSGGGIDKLTDEILEHNEVRVNFSFPVKLGRIHEIKEDVPRILDIQYPHGKIEYYRKDRDDEYPSWVYKISNMNTNREAAKFLLEEEY